MIWVKELLANEVPLVRIRLQSGVGNLRERETANLISACRDDIIEKDRKAYRVTRRVYEQTENGEWYVTIMGKEAK